DELVLQIDVAVAGGCHREGALRRGVAQCTLHGLPDRTLPRVVDAVELPRVDVVAVVRDRHAVIRCPEVRADRSLGEDVAVVVDDLHGGDLHAGRHARDADAVDRGGDGARHVRSVRGGRGAPRTFA